ncbi:MAG: preprotein translocase subunit YajC [Propionibacteriaceae bacterium]|nr:preprotein translocase subunit YajC [Propionibacteriaceae bacterium]
MPPGLDILLMIVVFGGIMYFLMIRPQQKRMREHQEMIEKLEPGTRVLLTSGIFATLLHMGDRQMIVEIAPGVEITVVKGHISRAVSDEDEEFVYEGEGDDAEAADVESDYATDEQPEAAFAEPVADEPEVTDETADRNSDANR